MAAGRAERRWRDRAMKAIFREEPGRLSLMEREPPRRGEDEILVRIRRVGMCGADDHIYQGDQPYLHYPRVIGRELSGEVVETTAEPPIQDGFGLDGNDGTGCHYQGGS